MATPTKSQKSAAVERSPQDDSSPHQARDQLGDAIAPPVSNPVTKIRNDLENPTSKKRVFPHHGSVVSTPHKKWSADGERHHAPLATYQNKTNGQRTSFRRRPGSGFLEWNSQNQLVFSPLSILHSLPRPGATANSVYIHGQNQDSALMLSSGRPLNRVSLQQSAKSLTFDTQYYRTDPFLKKVVIDNPPMATRPRRKSVEPSRVVSFPTRPLGSTSPSLERDERSPILPKGTICSALATPESGGNQASTGSPKGLGTPTGEPLLATRTSRTGSPSGDTRVSTGSQPSTTVEVSFSVPYRWPVGPLQHPRISQLRATRVPPRMPSPLNRFSPLQEKTVAATIGGPNENTEKRAQSRNGSSNSPRVSPSARATRPPGDHSSPSQGATSQRQRTPPPQYVPQTYAEHFRQRQDAAQSFHQSSHHLASAACQQSQAQAVHDVAAMNAAIIEDNDVVEQYLDQEQAHMYDREPLIYGTHIYWASWRVIESHYELQRVVFGAPPLIHVSDPQHPTPADLKDAHDLTRELWQQNLNQLIANNQLHAALKSAHRELEYRGATNESLRGENEELKEQVRGAEATRDQMRTYNGRLRDEIEATHIQLAQEKARTETASALASRLITVTSAHMATVAENAVMTAVTPVATNMETDVRNTFSTLAVEFFNGLGADLHSLLRDDGELARMRRLLIRALGDQAGPRSRTSSVDEDAPLQAALPIAPINPPPMTPIATTKWQQRVADAPDGMPIRWIEHTLSTSAPSTSPIMVAPPVPVPLVAHSSSGAPTRAPGTEDDEDSAQPLFAWTEGQIRAHMKAGTLAMPAPEDLPRHSPYYQPRVVAQPSPIPNITVSVLPGGAVTRPAVDQMSNTVSDVTDATLDEDYEDHPDDYVARDEAESATHIGEAPPIEDLTADLSRFSETRLLGSAPSWSSQSIADRAFRPLPQAAHSRGRDSATPTPTTEASHIDDYHSEVHSGAAGAFAWGSTEPSQPAITIPTAAPQATRRHISGDSTTPFAPKLPPTTEAMDITEDEARLTRPTTAMPAPVSSLPTAVAAPLPASPPVEVAPPVPSGRPSLVSRIQAAPPPTDPTPRSTWYLKMHRIPPRCTTKDVHDILQDIGFPRAHASDVEFFPYIPRMSRSTGLPLAPRHGKYAHAFIKCRSQEEMAQLERRLLCTTVKNIDFPEEQLTLLACRAAYLPRRLDDEQFNADEPGVQPPPALPTSGAPASAALPQVEGDVHGRQRCRVALPAPITAPRPIQTDQAAVAVQSAMQPSTSRRPSPLQVLSAAETAAWKAGQRSALVKYLNISSSSATVDTAAATQPPPLSELDLQTEMAICATSPREKEPRTTQQAPQQQAAYRHVMAPQSMGAKQPTRLDTQHDD